MVKKIPKKLSDICNSEKIKDYSKYIFLDQDDKAYIIQSVREDPAAQRFLDDNLGYATPNDSKIITKIGKLIEIKYLSHDKIEDVKESELVNHLNDPIIGSLIQ